VRLFPLRFARETLSLDQLMRILIQDSVRKLFFDGADWNENIAQAKTFDTVSHAEAFCLEHKLATALIVVQSKDGGQEISYPVGGNNALLSSKPATTNIKSLY
jgi:hypothetical protein